MLGTRSCAYPVYRSVHHLSGLDLNIDPNYTIHEILIVPNTKELALLLNKAFRHALPHGFPNLAMKYATIDA